MNDNMRWAIAVVAAALIIGLLAYGRGTAHHRGIDVGVHTSGSPALAR